MQTASSLSQSDIILKQDSTLIAVIEMSQSMWLVAGIVPGVERQRLKKLPVDGLVVPPDNIFMAAHRAPIILAAARNNVPAVYPRPFFGRDGGLLSYGPDAVDIFRCSASYVDCILRGAKPVDLPVQLPTRFEMAVNVKTAKALGLAVPPSILSRADEVIE